MTSDERIEHMLDRHVEHRTMVLPELKLLFAPVPKSGWTSILRLLADLAGFPPDRFSASLKPEVASHMLVHDYRVWAEEKRRLCDLPAAVRDEALTAPDWLRFAVVRHPGAKLWSGWQSKILLREPVYLRFHEAKPWYPARPRDPDEILSDFRGFVTALEEGFETDTRMRDPHWGRQVDVIRRLPLNHIGHLERLQDTVDVIREHVRRFTDHAVIVAKENPAPLPYDPVVYDDASAATVRRLFAEDFSTFGYPPVEACGDPDALNAWRGTAATQVPRLREIVARHERLAAYDAAVRARERVGSKERAALRTRVERLERSQATERRRRKEAQRELDAVRASTSWRLTAPLRALQGKLARRPGQKRPG